MDVETQPCGRFEWERIVRRIVMSPNVKLLAFILGSYADPDGSRVRPGLEVLASVTGRSRSSIQRMMRTLVDELGLLELVARGGGRSGNGKASEYRLIVSSDLLDRAEILPPNEVSEVTQVTSQSPVDNSDSEVNMVTSQSDEAVPIERSKSGSEARLRGQNELMRGHQSDPLPPTRPTTLRDHPVSHLPTQPSERARGQPKKRSSSSSHRRKRGRRAS